MTVEVDTSRPEGMIPDSRAPLLTPDKDPATGDDLHQWHDAPTSMDGH